MTTDAPPATWKCPDCDFRDPLVIRVYVHMKERHAAQHPREDLGHDPRTFEPRWEARHALTS